MTDTLSEETHTAAESTRQQNRWEGWIAALALCGIALYLILHFVMHSVATVAGIQAPEVPLIVVLALGGTPLLCVLIARMFRREFGSDLLAGISILSAAVLHEYLAGALVVLMLSGGQTLENYAVRNASSVLAALAKRMPDRARRRQNGKLVEIPLSKVSPGDILEVFPHELCPVDGTVVDGNGSMDESYLTGEPYEVSKAPGTNVLSGAINGESALVIRCDSPASDSRYAKIMKVMRDSEHGRPQLRRLGDKLGAWYTPIAVAIAVAAWAITGDPIRFLAVLVVATPCPLLIAIPVAIIGSISVAAAKGIIIKDPVVLESIGSCRTALFDKTGTLTYGRPKLTDIVPAAGFTETEILTLVASLERYSKHPLSGAITDAAIHAEITLLDAAEVREVPGDGLHANIAGHDVHVTGRTVLAARHPEIAESLPAILSGMECVATVDGKYAASFRFRDEPRPEGARFIGHLGPSHGIRRIMLVSGDRQREVAYLADRVGITDVFYGQSPEQKLALVRSETNLAPTLFLGDGINDAPALTAATVGIAFGNNSEITGEAADAVIMDSSLEKVDVLIHISRRMRNIALESAIGGMALSVVGMGLASSGYLTPVAGAVGQEVIDVLAVLNALRAAFPPRLLSDY